MSGLFFKSLVLTSSFCCTFGGAQPSDPGRLPLLRHTQAAGLLYSEVEPAGQDAVDMGWLMAIDHGLDMYELMVPWPTLVAENGTPTFDGWLGLVDDFQEGGLQTYFGISTIDTNNLQLPAVFVDPSNERELAAGVSFDSQAMIDDFGAMLDALVPELVIRDVFFIAIGNEIDIWLGDHPDQILPYATFLEAARERIHAIEPRMGVGSALTSDVVHHPEIAGVILDASDLAVFTYYPLDPSFSVLEPSVINTDLDAMLTVAGDKQVIIQEIGYPSGWPIPGNNSSVGKQREFVERMFDSFDARPRVRAWSLLHLGDWNPDQLDIFTEYYGIDFPEFVEYLGTLGLFWTDGVAKPGFEAFLMGLGGCAVDINDDGLVGIDDLYDLHQTPEDINGDGIADGRDIRCLEKYIRRFEPNDLVRRP